MEHLNVFNVRSPDAKSRLQRRAFGFLTLIAVGLGLRCQAHLLHAPHWVDEAETVVVTRLLASGQRLYGDVFNHHGPLVFFSGYLLEKLGHFDISVHRLPMALAVWAAIVSCAISPLLRNNLARLCCGAAVAALLLYRYVDIFSTLYIYQALAGCIVACVLAQWTWPSLYRVREGEGGRAAAGGFLLACLPFAAVFYAPCAALLFFASIRRSTARAALLGAVAGVTANVLFLGFVGSFAGYAAYHLHLNINVLPQVVGQVRPWPSVRGVFQSGHGPMFAAAFGASCLRAALSSARAPLWRLASVCCAIASLGMRGPGFHALPVVYAAVATGCLLLCQSPMPVLRGRTWMVHAAVLALSLTKLSLVGHTARAQFVYTKLRQPEPFAALIGALTEPEDPALCYTFYPDCYLSADRRPASGHFFYLPAQGLYDRDPKFGVHTDNAADIRRSRPKFIRADAWDYNGVHAWSDYAKPIVEVLTRDYVPLAEPHAYARKDLDLEHLGLARRGEPFVYNFVGPGGSGQSLPLRFSARQLQEGQKLSQLDVHFVTWSRRLGGRGRLRLQRADETFYEQNFSLTKVTDGRSTRFVLPPDHYVGGEIVILDGDGLGTIEAARPAQPPATCLGYKYADGRSRWTTGCPAVLVLDQANG